MARKPSPKPKHVAHSRKPKAKPTARQAAPHTPMEELDKLRAVFQSAVAPYIPAPLPPEATQVGRPTNYRPEFCAVLLEDAALGHTLGATCAILGCARSTVNEWAASHPEFAEALARAKQIRQRFYEGHAIDIARRGGDSTRMSAVKLGLLNVGGEDGKERLTSGDTIVFSLGDLIKQSMQLEAKTIEGQVIEPNKSDDGETLD